MDALTALHTRTSVNLLTYPGPTEEQLQSIVKAGLRACDHKSLKPWKFLLIQGESRKKFGDLMASTKKLMNGGKLDKEVAEKLKSKPFRAPCIIAVAAKIVEHEKVPEIEQVMSAAAAAQMMVTAAHALGLGAIWRSGNLMFHPAMRTGLGLDGSHKMVGFIYVGTPVVTRPTPQANLEDFLEMWN